MFAQAVDLIDAGTTGQKIAGQRLQVRQGNILGRGAQQCRTTAGDQADHQILRTKTLQQVHDTAGGSHPALVRQRMSRLANFDAGEGLRRGMTVLDNHQPGIDTVAEHFENSPGHGCTGFSGAHHHDPAHFGQVVGLLTHLQQLVFQVKVVQDSRIWVNCLDGSRQDTRDGRALRV